MANARRLGRLAVSLSLLALTLAVALPALAGKPVISYASSASMEPTIGTLDGFLVNPWPLSIGPGDIVVFHSVTRDGPAVHRVVAYDGDGWITKGDANARVDQDIGEPTLTRDRVLGKVVTRPDGSPLVFDQLGVSYLEGRKELVVVQEAVGGPRVFYASLFLLLALIFLVPAIATKKKRRLPTRIPLRGRVILRRFLPRGILGSHVGLALIVVLVGCTILAASNARHDVSVSMVVLQDPSGADSVRAAGPGQELRRDVQVGAMGFLPTVVIVDPETADLRAVDGVITLGPQRNATVEVWQRGRDEIGLQEDILPVWRYPAALPADATLTLHRLAPGLPYVVLAAIVAVVGTIWFAALRIRTLPVGRTLGIPEDWL